MIEIDKYDDQFGKQIRMGFDNGDYLNINYCGNLDLYFTPESVENKKEIIFEIGLDDYDLYQMFYKLYKKVSSYRALDNEVDKGFKKYDKFREYPLVKNNIITWISDDDPVEIASRVSIYHKNHTIFLHFKEGMHQEGFRARSIRFRTSGSRYNYFYIPFLELYNSICEHDFSYHQYSIDEYLLTLKKK